MNDDGQLNFIDWLSVMSFYIGLLNLDMNITQNDIAEQTADIDKRVNQHLHDVLDEIHSHLQEQDIKLSEIQKELEEIKNDSRRDI